MRPPPPPSSPFWKLWEVGTRMNVALFRLSGGRIANRMPRYGSPLILVHHVGARSGKHRVSPLIALEDSGRWVIVASKGGSKMHPAWFHNLKAHPETEIEVPRRGRIAVTARVLEGEERERMWPKMVAIYSPYEQYQRFAGERLIPLISLDPR